jgi:predicted nucleotidyltransferase
LLCDGNYWYIEGNRKNNGKKLMTKKTILEILERLQAEVQDKFKAEVKGIFGSYVRGDQSSSSDLDILVEFGPDADLFDFVALSDFLEGKLNCPVDLVPISSIREEIKADILKEAVYL